MRRADPGFADGLEGCEAAKGVEALGEVGGGYEGAEVPSELPVGFVVVAPHSRLLEGPVHSFDVTIDLRMVAW